MYGGVAGEAGRLSLLPIGFVAKPTELPRCDFVPCTGKL
jgi:hypothetical protein